LVALPGSVEWAGEVALGGVLIEEGFGGVDDGVRECLLVGVEEFDEFPLPLESCVPREGVE
jgi:hypothetical protein